jgi:hypothetical protein
MRNLNKSNVLTSVESINLNLEKKNLEKIILKIWVKYVPSSVKVGSFLPLNPRGNNWHYIECVPWSFRHLGTFLSVQLQCSQWEAKIISQYNIKSLTYLWQQISHPIEIRFNQVRCGKITKVQHGLLCCGRCRGKRNLWLNFKFEIFYSCSEIPVAHAKVIVIP